MFSLTETSSSAPYLYSVVVTLKGKPEETKRDSGDRLFVSSSALISPFESSFFCPPRHSLHPASISNRLKQEEERSAAATRPLSPPAFLSSLSVSPEKCQSHPLRPLLSVLSTFAHYIHSHQNHSHQIQQKPVLACHSNKVKSSNASTRIKVVGGMEN